ncbi:TIGR03915 family putative DNA repair protein [Clostridium thermarum]|uniref:TIGR03915 family putative DNA repair protein n=1 Tax=Clostridium thermarum TaxID=1716543 RepID=UPI0013D5CF04|nr:TIGR03915 family putative DNA repair protein [Clostridium thermarum]
MSIVYTYDGSFDGLLTCIYDYYYSEKKAEDIKVKDDFFPDLLQEEVFIETSEKKSSKVFNAIKDKIGSAALKDIFTVFLSEEPGMEKLILEFVKLGFKLGRDVHKHLHNELVLEVAKCCHRVNLESHRFCGFVRFKCVGPELYYSSIEPDHNILTLIAPHFAERFSSQKWIIHDVKRGLAVMYNRESWVLAPMDSTAAQQFLSAPDGIYEELWKTYYSSVTIMERENPRLRRRMMPQRYWKHLPEVK